MVKRNSAWRDSLRSFNFKRNVAQLRERLTSEGRLLRTPFSPERVFHLVLWFNEILLDLHPRSLLFPAVLLTQIFICVKKVR